MKLYHLYITAVLFCILTACKTQKPQSKEGSIESEIPALELIQQAIKMETLYEKEVFWVQTIIPKKDKLLPTSKTAFIIFHKDGSLSIQSICNTGRGKYKASNLNINISAEMTSRMACKKAEIEFQLFEGLRSANSFYQTGNKIFFRLKDGLGLMEFEIIN